MGGVALRWKYIESITAEEALCYYFTVRLQHPQQLWLCEFTAARSQICHPLSLCIYAIEASTALCHTALRCFGVRPRPNAQPVRRLGKLFKVSSARGKHLHRVCLRSAGSFCCALQSIVPTCRSWSAQLGSMRLQPPRQSDQHGTIVLDGLVRAGRLLLSDQA